MMCTSGQSGSRKDTFSTSQHIWKRKLWNVHRRRDSHPSWYMYHPTAALQVSCLSTAEAVGRNTAWALFFPVGEWQRWLRKPLPSANVREEMNDSFVASTRHLCCNKGINGSTWTQNGMFDASILADRCTGYALHNYSALYSLVHGRNSMA
jgi:hypothetical protein